MQYEYKTKGTCSQRIFFDIEDGKVKIWLPKLSWNVIRLSKVAK